MISFLNEWVQQIAIAVIIVSIIELILPSGNIKKYIKIVLGIYVIFSIISPFVNSSALYDIGDIDSYIDSITTNETTVNQTSIDDRLQELYIEQLEDDIQTRVEEKGYVLYSCNIDAELNSSSENAGIHKIDLTLKENQTSVEEVEIEINSNTTETTDNTKIEELKESLANDYEINKDIINISLK